MSARGPSSKSRARSAAAVTRAAGGWPFALALAACSAGCGSSKSGGNAPVPEFSEIEIAVILGSLGRLPEAPPADPTNRYADDADAAMLGQRFFFDPGYSADGQVSCATCHIPDKGFQDDRANTSLGIDFTPRHAPSLVNAAYGPAEDGATVWQFWDGARDSPWSAALYSPESPIDMGSTRSKLALYVFDNYRSDYEAVFGAMPELRDENGDPLAPDTALPGNAEWDALDPALQQSITQVFVNFGKALEAYERKLVRPNSRFDALFDTLSSGAQQSGTFSDSEALGLKTFVGAGRCASCHYGANFSDWGFFNTGLAELGDHLPAQDIGRQGGVPLVIADEFNCQSVWSDQADKSQCAVATLGERAADRGAFRAPGLRGVSASAPYFHTGTAATLADVVDFYDRGGDPADYVGVPDANVQFLGLFDDEKQGLVDFLKTLDGDPLDPALLSAPP